MPRLSEFSQLPRMKNKLPWTQSVVLTGKGVVIPSSGESPKPFSEMAFIGICMHRGIQYAKLINQCLKAIVTESRYYL